ncbi:MAG: hypothetical protein Q4F72_02895 [Desulfovibrionaceae bacterium]|nr:hypothetical protein [Desulfovibrionaceae bacterium]
MAAAFGVGHCTPIVAAGIGAGWLEAKYERHADTLRRVSSFVIIAIGLVFILSSF